MSSTLVMNQLMDLSIISTQTSQSLLSMVHAPLVLGSLTGGKPA
jgi:hypothetical protein